MYLGDLAPLFLGSELLGAEGAIFDDEGYVAPTESFRFAANGYLMQHVHHDSTQVDQCINVEIFIFLSHAPSFKHSLLIGYDPNVLLI